MTTQSPGTETPETVRELATVQVTLPRTALIGIFGSENAPGALIRGLNGKITRVAVGDEAAGGIVAAIGDDKIVIALRDETRVMALPAT